MRVSIALATHNGSRFLGKQLETIAQQTSPPAELVVYDDASTDGSIETVERFQETTPIHVRIIRGRSRIGSARAFERAIECCTGDLIALCDQDDVWRSNKIERIAETFERAPELALVFSDATVIDAHGSVIAESLRGRLQGRPPSQRRDLGFFLDSLIWPTVPGCTAVFRASCLDGAFPFPPWLGSTERAMQHDAWLISIASAIGDFEALPDRLIAYRVHPEQQIGLLGAPARRKLRSVPSRIGRLTLSKDQLDEELGCRETGVMLVSARLASLEADAWTRACCEAAADVAEHLQERISLPPERGRRVRAVLREWRSSRYRRYSSGALSALVDVVRR